jgi:hypothetical protein
MDNFCFSNYSKTYLSTSHRGALKIFFYFFIAERLPKKKKIFPLFDLSTQMRILVNQITVVSFLVPWPTGSTSLACKGKKNKGIIPDSLPESTALQSLDLSSISLDSESDPDLLDKQTLAQIREGNRISSTEWTPIATSNTSRNRTQKRKTLPSEAEPTRFPEWTPNTPSYLSKQKISFSYFQKSNFFNFSIS